MDGSDNLFIVIMALGAIWTVVVLVHRGKAFWAGQLGRRDQQLAAAVALFLVIPAGVFLHEVGHALAVWSVGGRVADFNWRLYAGSVTSVGFFSELESWWIALAGNVVGAIFGFALLGFAYIGKRLRRPLRYVLLVAGVLELLFALLGYPLLSVSDYYVDADWRDIYDFSATPAASAVSAAVHAALLAALWAWRHRLNDLGFGLASGTLDEVERLRKAIAADPKAVEPRVSLALHFARYHAADRAQREAEEALRRCGEHPSSYVPLTVALLNQGRYEEAVERVRQGKELAAREGLEVSGVSGEQWMQAHLGIALAADGRKDEALTAFSKLSDPMASEDHVRYWRAKAAAEPQPGEPDADA